MIVNMNEFVFGILVIASDVFALGYILSHPPKASYWNIIYLLAAVAVSMAFVIILLAGVLFMNVGLGGTL